MPRGGRRSRAAASSLRNGASTPRISAACRDLIGGLDRVDAREAPAVPPMLLEAASRTQRPRLTRTAVAVAAAACVLLAVSVSRQMYVQQGAPDPVPPGTASSDLDEVRNRPAGQIPQLVEPRGNQHLAARTRFAWSPVIGAVQYEIRVLTGDGEIVWNEVTSATDLEFAGPARAAGPYYAWVTAQLTDGRRVQSGVVRLAGSSR